MEDVNKYKSLIHEHLKKQDRKSLVVTPIFQHRNEESSQSDFQREKNEFKRKVIDRIVSPVPFDVVDSESNDKGDIEVCIEEYYHEKSNSLSPLLRRVAVRSYLGTVEERQVGVLHSSFSLPISDLPRNIVAEIIHQNNDNNGNNAYRDHDVSSKRWLCWTKFQSLVDKKSNQNRSNNCGKAYLCVLAGPRTLKVFDVYPKSKVNSDNVDEFSQGEGQTVTLPFEASSIFSLPAPYYGLLIQRAATVDEEVYMPTLNYDYYPIVLSNAKNNHKIEQNDGIKNNKEEYVVDGPPSTVRLELNNNFIHQSDLKQSKGDDRAMSPTPSSSGSEIGMEIPSPSPFNQVIPSLYTLHNPLDDILPCNILPNEIYSENESKTKLSVWRTTHYETNQTTQYFSNAFEHVIFVGKPRSFISFPSPQKETETDGFTFIVTFNSKFKRHAFWVLKPAHDPQLNVPLWQQTSQAMKNVNFDNLGILTTPTSQEDGDVLMSEQKVVEKSEQWNQTTSTFFDLHARVSIACIHTISFDESNDVPVSYHHEEVAKDVFFATNNMETGDFVLCVLHRINSIDSMTNTGNDYRLRCFSLTQHETCDSDIGIEHLWQIAHIDDIDCIAAQPIQAIPINPPSFNPFERDINKRQKFFSRWRPIETFDPPLAIDICVCTKSIHGTKLSIFREAQHIADCKFPTSLLVQTEIPSTHIMDLHYAVRDRIDVLCNGENDSHLTYRVSISLVNNSPITEFALMAIASSMLHKGRMLEGQDAKHSGILSSLGFAFRSDCAIFSQVAASFAESQDTTDDLEWYVFCSLLSTFFAFALNKASAWECMSTLESIPILDVDGDIDGDEAWENLLSSEFHSDYFASNYQTMFLMKEEKQQTSKPSILTNNIAQVLLSSSSLLWLFNLKEERNYDTAICPVIFDSLHLLYEEMKLSNVSGSSRYMKLLGNLLHSLSSRSCVINHGKKPISLMRDFVETYQRDLEILKSMPQEGGFNRICFIERVTSFAFPPCVFSLFEKVIKGSDIYSIIRNWSSVGDKLVLNGVCSTTVILFHFLGIFFDKKLDEVGLTERDRCLVLAMTQTGFNCCPSKFLQIFPVSIATIFMEVCYRCRLNPPSISNTWSASVYNFVGRSDLAEIQSILSSKNADMSIREHGSFKDNSLVTRSLSDNDVDKDGLNGLEKFSAMIFPNDKRVREVAKLLRSSRPTFLRVQRSVEVSDHDYERQKQEKLSLLCRRVVSLPLGRGMITYGTLDPVPAEPLSIPQLCLQGRVPPRNATIALEASYWTPEMKVWPEFHNGVAAGLRLPICTHKKQTSMGDIERSWIVYNKTPRSPAENPQNNNNNNNQAQQNQQLSGHAHGGFLMALGLRGYLSALSMPDVIDYLTRGSVTTAVGILLGMSANKRGTCDLSVSKMLCLHIPSLFPNSFSSIDVVSETQTAAVAGIGLLYQKSSHRLMTEFLLNEIGKRPTNEQNINDRESYSLCCGIALGMVNLCLRNKVISSKVSLVDDLSDLQIEEKLLRYIFGGLDKNFVYYQKGNSHINAGASVNESERCSRIYEGDMINTDITAPGATLALGMIYLKSG